MKKTLLLSLLCCLSAAAQVVDAPGVKVDTGGAVMLHRSPVEYPAAARRKGVAGTVMVEATLDRSGNVADARVISGPDELRRPALESVLQWHFANGVPGTTRQVSVQFQLPEGQAPAAVALSLGSTMRGLNGRTVRTINVVGLSDQAAAEFTARLPIHVGDTITDELIAKVDQTVVAYDDHLRVFGIPAGEGEASIKIAAGNGLLSTPDIPQRIKIGGNIQQGKLASQPRPIYPAAAKAAGVEGTVSLEVIISKEGDVMNVAVRTGDPMLAPAAMDAVRQWRYQPTLLNGNPVEVVTQVDVNFTLVK